MKLVYRDLKQDFEAGIRLVHVHVDSDDTKGKYGSYDTFFDAEALHFLRLYLETRKTERLDPRIQPEQIYDDSPIIRDELWDQQRQSSEARPIGTRQVYKIVHRMFLRAGLLKPGENRYDLRPHSLRKFFKTQLVAKSVPEPIVDFMMSHVTDTYNDVQALGVEHLRQLYAAARLSIRPSQEDSLTKTLVNLLRAAGKDPEKYLRKEAQQNPTGLS